MTELVAGLTLTTFLAFCGAAVAPVLTPGPDTMSVLARGTQGRGVGVRSALGISTGVLVHTLNPKVALFFRSLLPGFGGPVPVRTFGGTSSARRTPA